MEQERRRKLMEELRTRIRRIERGRAASGRPPLPFGVAEIDGRLPCGGLARGALHEVAGHEVAGVHPDGGSAAAALFTAGILARIPGAVLWILARRDLFSPALAGAGLHPDRVIYVETGDRNAVLPAMEECLRHAGLAGVAGEIEGRLTLTASRRLQRAAEESGGIAFALRRFRRTGTGGEAEAPIAAETRWRITALPSSPPLPFTFPPSFSERQGLGHARWRLDLIRCRGGQPQSWIVEAPNAQGRLGLAPDMADRSAAPAGEQRRPPAG